MPAIPQILSGIVNLKTICRGGKNLNLIMITSEKLRTAHLLKTNCYANYIFIQMKYRMDRIFPDSFKRKPCDMRSGRRI